MPLQRRQRLSADNESAVHWPMGGGQTSEIAKHCEFVLSDNSKLH